MFITYSNDGAIIDRRALINQGYDINEEKDIRYKKIIENGIEVQKEVLNFVGMVINDKAETLIVFPKNYDVKEIFTDTKYISRILLGNIRKIKENNFGKENNENYSSNYPFISFFEVYDYYEQFGLYFEDKIIYRQNTGKKIDWKHTISNSEKYLISNKLNFFPLYYRDNINISNFISECMIFIINHTIERFSFLIDLPTINTTINNEFFLLNNETVIEKLVSLKNKIFKDIHVNLINSMINFFLHLKGGNNFSLKIYNFSHIWEEMICEYLNSNFIGVKNRTLILGGNKSKKIKFQKEKFYVNKANTSQYIEIDFYYKDQHTQYLFDAKYYTEINGLDYKQISYHTFLDDLTNKNSISYSALILPSNRRFTKPHFIMNPAINNSQGTLIIMEEYFDIREVVKFYLGIN